MYVLVTSHFRKLVIRQTDREGDRRTETKRMRQTEGQWEGGRDRQTERVIEADREK